MNAFLADNLCDISLQHWSSFGEMKFSHTHPQYELYFCSDDVEQKSIINGEEYVYRYPCAILSSPYTVHAMSCMDHNAKRYERFVFYFDESFADILGKNFLPEGLICKNSGYMFRLKNEDADFLRNMIDAVDAKDKNQLRLLLALFLNKLVELSPVSEAICVGKSAFYIQDVLQYVAEHYFEQIDADGIAHRFLISRSKLDRDFKQYTGTTIHAFTDMCRLNQAKILLGLRPYLSISDIATHCGFTGETYFFPFFKRNTGMTPIQYRAYIESNK